MLSIDGQDVDYDMGTEIEVLEDPDDPLVGFEWNSDPNETTTRGIWFSQPFIVHKTGGEELAIILVDTQGLFDDESTQRDMSTIVGLSLLSASTLVFNVKRLKDDVLTIMHSFLDYGLQAVASVVADDADDEHRCDDIKPFQNLVFMIRDWSRPDSPTEYGLIGGQYFLNNRLKINERQCDAARNARQIIRKCFDNIDCYLMPDPGLVAQRSTFHGCDNELNTEFKDKVNEFCRYLVNPDTIKVKEINGQPITGQEFGHYFEAYVNMFNSESMPEACDLIEATHRAHDINLINKLKTDEGINVVSIQPYIQALHIHEFHRIATYREINQIRTDSTMSTVVENLKQQYESELAAWIDVTITEDRDRFKEASRRIRSHIVTENTLRYQHRLNLVQLCSQLDITEREMLDVFIGEVGVRSRANAAIIDQVLKWYNQRVKTEYGLQTYIRPDKLAKIHEGLVKAAVARFKGESPHLKPEAFADLIKKNLNIAYTHVTNQNNSNAPTVPAIGIDLGTTNSCVAYYRPGKSGETGHIQVCRNINMEVTPSCVEYKDNGEVVVGEEAKDNLLGSRRQIIYSAKRMIGRQFDDPKITEYSENWPFNVIDIEGAAGVEVEVDSESCQKLPEEVSADVLRKMKEIAERDLGHPVLDAVITVPAYFNDAQRLSTINAGIMAGLNVLSIINEPTAAALAFKLDRFDDSNARTVLVYDFGGGTFDVAILRLSMGSVEVLAVGGATDLGGDDLDQKIIDYCFSEFYLKTGVEIDQQSNEGERAKRALKDRCEREKWRLSEMTVATIAVDKIIDNLDLAIELTREKFEEINMSIFERTMNCVTTTMAKVNGGAGIKPEEIDDIILVGGSTYIPKVKTMITEYFNGREPSHSVNPMLAVAEGAALKAAILNGNEAYLNKYLQVREVTPHTLGVREHGNWMSPIIPAQSRVDGIPRTRVYTTVSDHQTEIEVEVYEGEDPVATNNTLLKQYVVTGIPPQTVGSQNVSIEFCINDDGVLKVKAKVLSQGTEQEMEVTEYKGRLSTDELIIQRHHL
ncbi:unnamed protein product [Medioppia subpectinata]|uniref:GB1/RHD3-type G domain-containing protein n=1 Tax=Medioppia subpectinata TaxID=1979941 RepID=A0A7R9KDX3_9ACAR|nr:unnamed protein product [Medioppia subpectinata]CAG2101380.1 unnamed protein product [Medioppia subpectinata]